jgi:hypothetical protein
MSNALSEGRYPRQPDRIAVLTICKEDFRKFNDRNGNTVLEYLSTLIKDLEKRGLDPDIYKRQKENLEEVESLVVKGKEKVAFNLFTRTFPYCMPHRSIL